MQTRTLGPKGPEVSAIGLGVQNMHRTYQTTIPDRAEMRIAMDYRRMCEWMPPCAKHRRRKPVPNFGYGIDEREDRRTVEPMLRQQTAGR